MYRLKINDILCKIIDNVKMKFMLVFYYFVCANNFGTYESYKLLWNSKSIIIM